GALSLMRNVRRAMESAVLTPATPFFIGCFAQVRSAFLGEYRGGARWAREGEQAATRLASPFFPVCSFFRGGYAPYESPVEQSRVYYRAAVRVAMASGSFQGAGWGLAGELALVDLWAGRPLSQLAAREEAQRDLMTRAGDAHGLDHFALAASFAAFL